MAVITFDALKFVERLTAAGISDAQAKAEASALCDVFVEVLDTTIATKADVREVRVEIDLLRRDMQAMELRLIIKLGAIIAAAVGILITVLRVTH